MEEEKNRKVIWYILFTLVTILLCYLFVVVFFYYISPYNISLKIALWPFLSDESVSEMYSDAVVEINFFVENEDFDEQEKTVLGVNVKKDGYIVAPFSEFVDMSENSEINIIANSGKIYAGNLLYTNKDFNISIIKCNSYASQDVKIPYVDIADGVVEGNEILCVDGKNSWAGEVISSGVALGVTKEIDGLKAIDFVLEDGFVGEFDQNTLLSSCVVFDKNANLLGFYYPEISADIEAGAYFFSGIYGLNFVLEDVVDCFKNNDFYQNKLVDSFVGFDNLELSYFYEVANINLVDTDKFYFNNKWHLFNDSIYYFHTSGENGFYVCEDVVYNETTLIPQYSVVSSIRVGNESFSFENSKLELFEILLSLNSGDRVSLYYYEIRDSQSISKSTTFYV